MKRFWISWEQLTSDFRPIADPPQPENIKAWWCSGHGDHLHTMCAIVEAESEEAAEAAVLAGWQMPGAKEVGEFRFCEEKAADWLPGNRFPINKDWVKQRLGI